jgi:predicted DNA-binding transcriptional regulator YafY
VSDTAARSLRLLSLLQTYRFWPGDELADRLEVSVRTLRRDIDRLRDLGYPIIATPGPGGGYRMSLGGALPPLVVDDEEAVALVVGLRAAAAGGVAGLQDTSGRAMAKVEQALPARLRREVVAVARHTVPLVPDVPTVPPEVLIVVARACHDQERLRFDYRRRDRSTSERLVEPHSLVLFSHRWYLVAWDVDRADWRTFRLDRAGEIEPTSVRAARRELPGGDPAAYVAHAIQQTVVRTPAAITLHAPLEVVADRLPTGAGHLEFVDSQTCRLRTEAYSLDWLALTIGMLDVDFDVDEPPEFVDYLRRMIARWSAAAGRAVPGQAVPGRVTPV